MLFRTGATGLATFGSVRMAISSTGLVSINGTNAQERFRLQNTDGASYLGFTEQEIRMWRPNDSGADLQLATQALTGSWSGSGGRILLSPRNSISLVVTGGGNTLLGTQSDNGERLYVSGSIRATGSITANSDITLKKNLLKIENALEKVEQINGYTYELKEDDSKRHGGVIAQEIDKVFPEIVNKGNDGLMGVEYGNISALLIEAIKEQQTQIKELKALLNK